MPAKEGKMRMFLMTVVVLSIPYVKGSNVIYDKPSKMSLGPLNNGFVVSNGNDGSLSSHTLTQRGDNPYWQGDLQTYYRVSHVNISIPYNWRQYMRDAYVGVSINDVDCPGSDVIICGQWVDQSPVGEDPIVQTFNCGLSDSVRYVRIWRETTDVNLGFSEVEVEGVEVETHQRVKKYEPAKSMKLTVPSISLTVSMVTECATNCFKNETCIFFSFRQGGQLNCLLGSDVSVTFDTDWINYKVTECFKPPVCHELSHQ